MAPSSFETRAASMATRLIHRAIQTGDLMWLTKTGSTLRTFTNKDAEELLQNKKLNMKNVVGVYNQFAEAEWIIEDINHAIN